MASTLSPHDRTECSSPGSSIFDLPTTTDVHRTNTHSQALTNASANAPGVRPHATSHTTTVDNDADDLEEGEGEVPTCLVISGGTGCNAICSAFGRANNAAYVLPVSDDGGSSSEIIRVIGGPSIGMHHPCYSPRLLLKEVR